MRPMTLWVVFGAPPVAILVAWLLEVLQLLPPK